jgi:hypothetical protein
VATIQGRPLGIRDETFDVQLPSLQEVEADATSLTSSDLAPELSIPAIVAFSIHRFKLDPIISEIKLLFYHLPSEVSAYSWPAGLQTSQKAIRQRLDNWRRELSSVSNILPQNSGDEDSRLEMRRYELKVQIQFFAAMILLYQPSQMIPHPGEEALLMCYQCAASRINIYNSLYNSEGLFQSWRSVQGVFSSGATMIYCLWTSTSVQRSVPLPSAMTDLRTCTNLLSIGGEWWPSVKRGKETFGRAMDALLKKLDQTKTSSRTPANVRNTDKRLVQNIGHQSDREIANFEALAPAPSVLSRDVDLYGELNTGLPSGFDVPSQTNVSIDYGTTDWTLLDTISDEPLQFGTHGIENNVFGTSPENMDSTVEAFITEYLQNGTSYQGTKWAIFLSLIFKLSDISSRLRQLLLLTPSLHIITTLTL